MTFLDAATWLAQIVMFVLLGLLVSPQRLVSSIGPAVVVALALMLVARPVAVFLCLAPFRFNWREKIFIAWTGLRGAVAIFLASIPMLVGLSKAYLYFDVAFVVVIISLLLQGWTLGPAARKLHVALPRADRGPRRVELDLPGQLEQQLVGYSVRPKSLYFRRGLIPSWSKPTLVIRDQKILSPAEADPVAPGDYIYLLAPPEKAEALDRFFVDMAPSSAPDPHLLGDFMVSGEHTLGELAEIYGVAVDEEQGKLTLADYFDIHLDHAPKEGAELVLDPIVLVARSIGGGRVNVVGLRLPEEEEERRAVDADWRGSSASCRRSGRRWRGFDRSSTSARDSEHSGGRDHAAGGTALLIRMLPPLCGSLGCGGIPATPTSTKPLSLVEIHGGDVVGPYVQAQAVVTGFRRAGFGPSQQSGADAGTAVRVADGEAVQEHAAPVLQLQHRPDMVVALGAEQHVIVVLQQVGGKNIRGGDDLAVAAEGCNATIAVGNRIAFAADAGRQQIDGGHERDQVVEQEFVDAAAGDAHVARQLAAVVGTSHAVGDLIRHSRKSFSPCLAWKSGSAGSQEFLCSGEPPCLDADQWPRGDPRRSSDATGHLRWYKGKIVNTGCRNRECAWPRIFTTTRIASASSSMSRATSPSSPSANRRARSRWSIPRCRRSWAGGA